MVLYRLYKLMDLGIGKYYIILGFGSGSIGGPYSATVLGRRLRWLSYQA